MENRILIWDVPTRVFHWSLVALVATGLVTGLIAPEWWMGLHVWAGYGTVLLVVFRLIWGVFGTEYSRIETFTFSPAQVFAHLRELIFLRPRHYLGHNPAGAMMIFTLLFILAGISVSGLLALGGEENQGPLAGAVNYAVGDAASGIHGTLVFVLMALIAGHLTGVIVETRLTRENLLQSMIDGYRKLPTGCSPPRLRPSHPLAAAAVLLAFALLAGSVLWAFSRMPPSGITQLAESADYADECSACHELYHPSLLPESSWAMLMADLQDHFGEDASVDEQTRGRISAHLSTHAAEAWDTEASNRFTRVSAKAPYQISASAYWLRKHGGIDPAVFNRDSIGGRSSCSACHLDAASGQFDDQKITIPGS